MRRILPALLAASCLLLAACGGSAPAATGGSTAASQGKQASGAAGGSLVTLQGANRLKTLEAAAKKEGEVDWYTSLAGPVVQAVGQAFEKKYPGVHVSTFRSDSRTLTTKLLQSAQAHRYSTDVISTTPDALLQLVAAHLLQPYYTPAAATLSAKFRIAASGSNNLAVGERVSYISFGYNKTLVPASAVPKTINGLLNPALKGKMVIETSTTGTRWIGGVYHALGAAKAKQFFAQMAKQQVKAEALSGAATMGLIAGGQMGASPSVFQDHALQQAQKGAPVAWVPMSPVVANVGMVAVVVHAPHPGAATLFADYLAGSGVQPVYSKFHYDRPATKVPFESDIWVPESSLTAAQYNQAAKQWQKTFKATFK